MQLAYCIRFSFSKLGDGDNADQQATTKNKKLSTHLSIDISTKAILH